MKKSIYLLLFILCFVLVGCGQNDYMVGEWQIVSYEYIDAQNQFSYTSQEITDLIEKYQNNSYQPTNLQERLEQSLTSIHQHSADVVYSFTNKNVVDIKKDNQTTMSYTWTRNDNIILLTYDTLEIEWTLDEEQAYCFTTTTFENGYLTAYYKKI